MNARQIVLRAALEAVRDSSPTRRLNALEVGCMFKQDEAQSTYEIARFLAHEMLSGSFYSIENNSDHLASCRELMRARDPQLLERVQFLEGMSHQRMPEALARIGELDLAFLDGGAGPLHNLHEFELAIAHLAPCGLIVVDDLEPLEPTRAFPHPRPYGKGTLILPFLVVHEYLRMIGVGPGSAAGGGPGVRSQLCDRLLEVFGSHEHRIVRSGGHAMLLMGAREVVETAHARAEEALARRAAESSPRQAAFRSTEAPR